MDQRILAELKRVERECEVRILLAVESGSRAWGFASPDSDYDVRFVYAHRRDWYLSVQEQRDVIEEMLPGDLDVSGWELRKALRLFAKCNLAFNEWVGSPITYRADSAFRAQLTALLPRYFNAIAGTHHYRQMADRSLGENYIDGRIGIKKIFYVLRPLLACRWIEHAHTQPPTEFSRLVGAEWVSADERQWIGKLLEEKAGAAERHAIALDADRAAAIRSELARYGSAEGGFRPPEKYGTAELDEMMRRWVK